MERDIFTQFFDARETWLFLGTYIWLLITMWLIYVSFGDLIWTLWFIFRAIPILGCIATVLVSPLTIPAMVVHETGHGLLAWPLGAGIFDINYFPRAIFEKAGVKLELGLTQITELGKIRSAILKAAPIFFGSVLLYFVYQWGIDIQPPPAFHDLVDFMDYVQQGWTVMLSAPWLFVLVYGCGVGAMPGQSDWDEGGSSTALVFTILAGIVYFLFYFLIPNLSDVYWWLQKLTTLNLAFSLALSILLVIYVPLKLLYILMGSPRNMGALYPPLSGQP